MAIGAEVIDQGLAARAAALRERAQALREQATGLGVVVGATFRRRASELELAAWALDARAGIRHEDATDPTAGLTAA